MNKKKVLIIVGLVLGVIMLSLLSAYLWKKYQTSKNSAEVIAVSEKYTENYGTYDSQNNVSEYLASLKPYLVDDSYSQIAQGFNNPNADKEVREYEKSIKYKIKTTALNSKVVDLSKYNKMRKLPLTSGFRPQLPINRVIVTPIIGH